MTTRERIINAAIIVFAAKGRYGAKVEEIARQASINKAMVYYIFRSKDELYFEMLKTIFSELFVGVTTMMREDMVKNLSSEEKLVHMISWMFDSFLQNEKYTKIMVDAISNGSEEIPRIVAECKKNYGTEFLDSFSHVLREGTRNGSFRKIDADQLQISIHGIVMIVFLSGSLSDFYDIHVPDRELFLKQRKASIIDLVFNGILATRKTIPKAKSVRSK